MYPKNISYRVLLTAIFALLFGACSKKEAEQTEAAPQATAEKTAPAKRPNIIFILADDIGFADIGINGQKNFTTPNIDKLAAAGMNFTNFYAGSAVCGPSRSVLMTGLHTGRTPIRANTMEYKKEDGTIGYKPASLKEDELTVAEVLQDAGYQTGLIGKWGLGEMHDSGNPLKKGFDYFYGMANHIHAHNHFSGFVWRNEEKVKLKNEPIPVECSYCYKFGFDGDITPLEKRFEYVDTLMREEVEAFIERNAKSDKPFFLFYSMIAPHANNEAEKVDWAHGMEIPDYGEFASKDWPDEAKGYAAMMRHVDDSVGAVVEMLKKQGIADNTLVMFSGDNGPHSEGGNDPDFHDSNGTLRGIKRDLYEGGIRMPTFAWGPGIVKGNTTSDHIGYFGDMMATFSELAGVSDKVPEGLDSISFVNELKGNFDQQQDHEYVYWEFLLKGSSQAIRMGKWKAIRLPLLTGPIELYDLENDPGETTDVAKDHPDLISKFEKIMQENYIDDPHWVPSKEMGSPDRLRQRGKKWNSG